MKTPATASISSTVTAPVIALSKKIYYRKNLEVIKYKFWYLAILLKYTHDYCFENRYNDFNFVRTATSG